MQANGEATLAALREGRLAGAQRLDLSADLSEFPREVFALADTLEVLNLSSNRLQSLPDDLPRLHRLRVVFCSDNDFTELPAVLGRCPALQMVGFKANRIEHVSDAALPRALRWLILTDNRLEALPDALGGCASLQKLMLAGNRLRRLPASLAQCQRLELVRLAANAFDDVSEALPAWLLSLPRLAWLAVAGNPFNEAIEARVLATGSESSDSTTRATGTTTTTITTTNSIDWTALHLQRLIGEGASGHIHAATWPVPGAAEPQPVAVKLFKGAVTSDGLPRSEMAACIAAGSHPNLVGLEGRLGGHPQGTQGLVLPMIPPRYRNLAGPPSLDSCTRDVYAEGLRFTAPQALRIATGVAAAVRHLHACGLVHGDLYAHNLLVDDDGHALLGDFGAASFVPPGDAARAQALQRLDRRALGWLIDELAQRCGTPGALDREREACGV